MIKKHIENIQMAYKDAVTKGWIESVYIDLIIYLVMKIDPQTPPKLVCRCVSLNISFLRTNTV